MARRSYQTYDWHGHTYYCKGRLEDGPCYYSDNDEPVDFDNPRPCKKCGMEIPVNDHDPCIANLPGVKYACCGHGKGRGYVAFTNGKVIRGYFDKEEMPKPVKKRSRAKGK